MVEEGDLRAEIDDRDRRQRRVPQFKDVLMAFGPDRGNGSPSAASIFARSWKRGSPRTRSNRSRARNGSSPVKSASVEPRERCSVVVFGEPSGVGRVGRVPSRVAVAARKRRAHI